MWPNWETILQDSLTKSDHIYHNKVERTIVNLPALRFPRLQEKNRAALCVCTQS